MRTIQESLPEKDLRVELPPGASAHDTAVISKPSPQATRQSLPPKGSCWYCEKPLDNVRRFCGKECADGFDVEAQFIR